MNKKELNEGLQIIEASYPGRFIVTENVLRVWYEVFKNSDSELFKDSVWEYVKNESKVPSLAEIRNIVKEKEISRINVTVSENQFEPLSDEEWEKLTKEGKL